LFAKRKAAERLGFDTRNLHLPTNMEVESALAAHQRLFKADTQPAHIRQLRKTARDAMRLLNGFDARLVGPVLAGTAADHAIIYLHVFTDVPENVAIFSWRNTFHMNFITQDESGARATQLPGIQLRGW